MRFFLLPLLLVPLLLGCKPEREKPTAYRVSLAEALADRGIVGLDKDGEELPAAMVGPDQVSVGELVRVLQTLPPVSRFFYSETYRAELFLKDYIILNLAAREGLNQVLWKQPHPRGSMLAAFFRQEKDDWLAGQVSAAGLDSEGLAKARRDAWQRRLEELRAQTPVTIDEEALAAFEKNHATKRSSQ